VDWKLGAADLQSDVIDLRVPEGVSAGDEAADAADAEAEPLGHEGVRERQRIEARAAPRRLDDDAERVGALDAHRLPGSAAAGPEAVRAWAGGHVGGVAVLGEVVELAVRADDAEVGADAGLRGNRKHAGERHQRRRRRNRRSDSHL
jgi:hypothetical protein